MSFIFKVKSFPNRQQGYKRFLLKTTSSFKSKIVGSVTKKLRLNFLKHSPKKPVRFRKLRRLFFSKVKRLVINYVYRRCFFWLLYFFSKLDLIMLNIRFVLWLNFFHDFFKEASFFSKKSLLSSISYFDTFKYISFDFAIVFSRYLFFYKTFSLWRTKNLLWNKIIFSSIRFFRVILGYTYYFAEINSLLVPFHTIAYSLSTLSAERRLLSKWFIEHKLPKWKRTRFTYAQWNEKVVYQRLVNRRFSIIRRYVRRRRYAYFYPKNLIRMLF